MRRLPVPLLVMHRLSFSHFLSLVVPPTGGEHSESWRGKKSSRSKKHTHSHITFPVISRREVEASLRFSGAKHEKNWLWVSRHKESMTTTASRKEDRVSSTGKACRSLSPSFLLCVRNWSDKMCYAAGFCWCVIQTLNFVRKSHSFSDFPNWMRVTCEK